MNSVRRVLGAGILFGLCGVGGQLVLLWFGAPTPVRAGWTFLLAVLIGALAGFTGKEEALKAAGLAGFLAGVMVTATGIVLVLRNPAILGSSPFSSAEAALSFIGSVLTGTVISSWLVAGIAVLVALPISQTLRTEAKEL
jgi:hypothetical protein